MRKTVFVCDRCGAEIDGLPAMIEVQTIRETTVKDLEPVTELADVEELARLFTEQADRESVRNALMFPHDLCAECVKDVLSTLINATRPKATVKVKNLPDTKIKKRGRPARKKDESED